jgi:hypothetical protein
MKPDAIVYTSNTGFTARYAKMLSEETKLPVYTLSEAAKRLPKGTPVIYMGWLFASNVKDYAKAVKRYDICAVCGVGLCTTGSLLNEVRQTAQIPEGLPLFTVQGGMDHTKLKGLNKFMIYALTRLLDAKTQKTADEKATLALLKKGGDYVDKKHLGELLAWYGNIA